MDWPAVAAICAALALIGGVFLWVVRMVTQSAIHEAVNGFKTKIALLEQRVEISERKVTAIDEYAHKEMHERIGNLAALQLEAFRAGQAAGR
jgi:hypothetical protein